MAQSGYTPISLYYSTTAAAAPTSGNLVAGELALNTTDEKLYFKNTAGTVKQIAGPGVGGITYTTTKTANYTAVANDGVLTNTTAGAFTVNLPASPSNGDQVIVADAAGTWGTNNLTVGRNGNNIADVAQDLVCDISGASVQFVYNSSGTASWEVFAQIGGNGGTAVTLTGTQTLTNKTLTAPTIASANLTTALTLAGAAGSNGQVLTSAGSGLPSWTTPSAGALTLLSTVTASASATVDVETTFSSTYDAYMLVVSGATPATDSRSLYARMKIGGSYITTSSYISTGGFNSLAGNQEATLATEITLVNAVWGNDAPSSCDVVIWIFNPSSTAFKKQLFYQATSLRIDTGVTQVQTRSGVGINDNTGALTGIRFFASSGNISAGKFRLYGIANS